MDKCFRYINFLKQSNWGINLRNDAIFNYLKNIVLKKEDVIDFKRCSPPLISIMATKRCNLNCSFCICGKFPSDWRDYELTEEKMNKILALSIVKKGILICFTGGEPLLNQGLENFFYQAKREKHLIGMISNGLLLKERINELVKCGLIDTQVSIYENTKKRLEYVFETVTKQSNINASYVLTKEYLLKESKRDFINLLDLIIMCKETGCQSLKFNICDTFINSKFLSFDKQIYDEFIKVCRQKLKNIILIGYNCQKNLPSPKFTVYFPHPFDDKLRSCRIPWDIFMIDANGNYGICCRLQPDVSHGNIFENDAVINSNEARIIRCGLTGETKLSNYCKGCVHLSGSYISAI